MAKQDFSALMSKVKESQANTPVQKVVPIKEKKKKLFFLSIFQLKN